MTIHERKGGKQYFDTCRKVTAAAIREIGEWNNADGRTDEKTHNAAMRVLVTCLDGNRAK